MGKPAIWALSIGPTVHPSYAICFSFILVYVIFKLFNLDVLILTVDVFKGLGIEISFRVDALPI